MRIYHKTGMFIAMIALVQMTGCSSVPPAGSPAKKDQVAKPGGKPSKGGGYYLDDGPGENPPENLEAIPNAEPKPEPLHRFANRPYTVLGQTYTPATQLGGYKKQGIASWYGRRYHGQKTAIGDTYDMYGMTAAHPTLPIPSYVRVTSLSNGKSVIVRVNDRGPFHSSRLIDLSYTAAWKLGVIGGGTNLVQVESVLSAEPSPGAPVVATLAPTTIVAQPLDATTSAAPLSVPPAAEQPVIAPPPAAQAGSRAVPPTTISDGQVYLQLGAFSSRENAESFGSKVRMSLGKLVDKLQVVEGNNLFRVRLGPYANRADANQIASQISQAANIPAVIAR
ncbi:MAG: septal ring lytic transglycosylase RlpA family protein [Sulfuricellaceae bacterium]|nr:septal ring lytic transglycosylase RlpA family protein [Sulfuricellaceae bacterium]